jgi:hypothetical protein
MFTEIYGLVAAREEESWASMHAEMISGFGKRETSETSFLLKFR